MWKMYGLAKNFILQFSEFIIINGLQEFFLLWIYTFVLPNKDFLRLKYQKIGTASYKIFVDLYLDYTSYIELGYFNIL